MDVDGDFFNSHIKELKKNLHYVFNYIRHETSRTDIVYSERDIPSKELTVFDLCQMADNFSQYFGIAISAYDLLKPNGVKSRVECKGLELEGALISLLKTSNVSDSEVKAFMTTYQKLGSSNVVERMRLFEDNPWLGVGHISAKIIQLDDFR